MGELIDSFLTGLAASGYTQESVRKRRYILRQLAGWLKRRRIPLDGLQDRHVDDFIKRGWRRGPSQGGGYATVRNFLEHARARGSAPPLDPAPERRLFGVVLGDFDRFLRDERGLSEGTRRVYVSTAADLLGEAASTTITRITPKRVVDFMAKTLRLRNRSAAHSAACGLRAFLRCLHATGRLPTDLSPAVPRVLMARNARLPEHLQPAELERLLRRRGRPTQRSSRNRAILLLLGRLGLRGCEIVRLRIDDVDWRAGTILVRGKRGKLDRLPLPDDVGEQLADYLSHHRPRCRSRCLFICLKAPFRPFGSTRPVSSVVAAELGRAGVSRLRSGAGLLRHSLATTMLKRRATLPEIGLVLRHEHALTTRIYAKVDVDTLRCLARPWPTRGAR